MGLNLSMNLPMFVHTFQAIWRHRPLKEYLVFVGIRAAHTSFSLFTLGISSTTAWKQTPVSLGHVEGIRSTTACEQTPVPLAHV